MKIGSATFIEFTILTLGVGPFFVRNQKKRFDVL